MKTLPSATRSNRRWRVVAAIALLQILLMGSAFVGGRLLAEQNQRTARPGGAAQLAAQLPKEPMAGSGTVQKVQDNIITLGRGGFGGPPGQGGPGGAGTSSQTEVAVSADTRYYKAVGSGGGNPGPPEAGQSASQAQDATLNDIKVGNNIMVWGVKNGERITAQVIFVQSSGR